MNKSSLAILAVTLLASRAEAQSDPRLKSVNYEADKIVSIQGRIGYQSMIEFASGEHIENVAVGDSSAWQVTPNKRANLLFLKPLLAKAKTNMTVVTDERVYLFDLGVAATGNAPFYNLRFNYVAQKPSTPQRIAYPNILAGTPAGLTAAAQPVAVPQLAGKLNFAWKTKGKKDVRPTRTYDDGRSLYLEWKSGTPLPVIIARGADGAESPLNYRVRGSVIVVDQVPKAVLLRVGTRTAILINRSANGDRARTSPTRYAER
jgi:type IV secretion system protein VirB9